MAHAPDWPDPPQTSTPPDTRARWPLLVTLIIVCGAALRFSHLDAGIPYALGVDEPQIMDRVVHMMKTGDFNPHFFDWPSLTFYLQLSVTCLTFLGGAMNGQWSALAQVEPAHFYENGRMLTAALGTATIWLVYAAARRWGPIHAVMAAAVMAVVPFHVRESHYVLTDVPAAFFVALAFLLTLRARERGTLAAFALAGVAVGLAASAKYNGLVVMVLPLLVALFDAAPLAVRAQRILVVGGAAVAVFVAGTPYAVLDLPKFLTDYARLAAVFARERGGEPGWSIYLKHLKLALGWPALLLGFAGLAVSARRIATGPDRLRWLLLATFSVLYFQVMAGSYQIYGRYLLPLFPFVSVLVAVGAIAVVRSLRGWLSPRVAHALLVVVAIGAMAQPAWTSVAFARRLGRPGTIDLAYRWIEQRVPQGSKIVIERAALTLPDARYESVDVRSLITRTYEEYAADGIEFILASSEGYGEAFAGRDAPAYVAYQTLFTKSEELAAFRPTDDSPGPELRLFRITPR
jgi:4-amino-4-deoxy-L-arabinose transferase-like glycosyltransferase